MLNSNVHIRAIGGKKKVLIVAPLLVFLFQLTLCSGASETRRVWGFDWERMKVDVYAPYQAHPNDTLTIRVRVEAKENLRNVTVLVRLYGCKSEGYEGWNASFYALYHVDLSSEVVQDQDFDIRIPSDVSPGLVYCHTSCIWHWPPWTERSYDGVFMVTYLKNKPCEDLQVDYNDLLNEYNNLLAVYNSLNATYTSLLSDYDNLSTAYNTLKNEYNSLHACYNSLINSHNTLQSDYDLLNTSYTSLQNAFNDSKSAGGIASTAVLTAVYVLIATTAILATTTVYFARRKPKRRRKPKTKTKSKS